MRAFVAVAAAATMTTTRLLILLGTAEPSSPRSSPVVPPAPLVAFTSSRPSPRAGGRSGVAAAPPTLFRRRRRHRLGTASRSATTSVHDDDDDDDDLFDANGGRRPWYADPSLDRDRSRILSFDTAEQAAESTSETSKFALFRDGRAFVESDGGDESAVAEDGETASGGDGGGGGAASGSVLRLLPAPVKPLYLSYEEAREVSSVAGFPDLLALAIGEESSPSPSPPGPQKEEEEPLLLYVGLRDGIDHWAVHLPAPFPDGGRDDDDDDDDPLDRWLSRRRPTFESSFLRQYGDRMDRPSDSAIAATANGLIEFHRSHPFCSRCGSPTASDKAGACRTCSNPKCRSRVYPRIDAACIVLIESPCKEYALLGRKRGWPKGRYSTLAGFAEVGETLEDCVSRETFEESGVIVERDAAMFVASQPWPFPRSLMVGFRATASKAKALQAAGDASQVVGGPGGGDDATLPIINVDVNELEDAKWFHWSYVLDRLDGGSSALDFEPNEREAIFHVPGRASLARLLIAGWTDERRRAQCKGR